MKTKRKTVFLWIAKCITAFLCLIILLTAGIGIYLTYGIDSDISTLLLFTSDNQSASKLYYVNKEGTLSEYGENQLAAGGAREYVLYEKIPDDLINAFIAIEDKRFLKHIGFDPITTGKAVLKYIFGNGNSPGGSTITQQLIKNLTGDDEISIKRKLTEIMKAIKLEKELSKEEILEIYLNTIYLSQGCYGVSAAARLYFNKSVEELSLIECAALASITQAPTKWDPILHPENNIIRRNTVLNEMYKNDLISYEELQNALSTDLVLSPCYDKVVPATSSWYTDAVISETLTILEENLSVSRKVAEHHLYSGGYRIVISVNPELQQFIENVYQETNLFSVDGAQSSFVIIAPQNGRVLALVGGVGEKDASRILNRATQTVRSPGSALKPISVYLPALEKGIIHYGSSIDDVPLYFGNQFPASGWPKNASGIYRGLVDLDRAIVSSLNTAAVATLEDLGVDLSFQFLQDKLKISTLDEHDRSLSALALGGMTKGVTLLELAAAYTPLASRGLYNKPHTVIAVYDNTGGLVYQHSEPGSIVCREDTAQVMTKLLQGVINKNTGTAYGAITSLTKVSDAAGKTGTTSNELDRWFIGYTPELIGGIWVGYDDPRPLTGVKGKEHLRIWDMIMTQAQRIIETPNKSFDFSLLCETRYCSISGKIATEACYADPRGAIVKVGFFTKETLPKSMCDTHIAINYCQIGGGIAGEYCPEDSISTVGLILAPRSFPVSVTVVDAQYTAMLLPDNFIPCLVDGEPYYQYYVSENHYSGKSNTDKPFNQYCLYHNKDRNISEKLVR